jgi:hypothetical protein
LITIAPCTIGATPSAIVLAPFTIVVAPMPRPKHKR